MSDIPKAYEPNAVEAKHYKNWLENNCFSRKRSPQQETFTITIPPPNVTGVLTMGHVLNNTLQDILIRRARQKGKAALWIPGTDHAGIATQTKVEKELRKEGISRHDVGREVFLEKAKDWRDKHGGIIIEQLKRLGSSCAWDQCVHTLDDGYSHAVISVFVELYKRGYIYRGKRMVNWCPVSLTALSDEEVVMKSSKGKLYLMKYELVEEPGRYLEIATTRPETIMGDTGVAVNPQDERYKHLIGKNCWRPFPREAIPIVGDDSIDMEFGTGVLKVTPAHDKVDFEIGKRNNLPVIDVMNPDGTLNHLAGEFAGMSREDARKATVKKLHDLGLLVEEKEHENNVGFSERANVPIEPRFSDQWFLRYPKVEEAKEAVSKGLIRFFPERWSKTYLHWLENIQDWCISRQLWWGHRIPVWYKKGADRNDPQNWHISVEGPADPQNWEQDEDVLDTWFSSWLWPFAVMGWPNEDAMKSFDFKSYYPTNDLVTGPDIIFFWVARMIMAGLEFTGSHKERLSLEEMQQRIPFKNVYFTGIIRDQQGRKMSKSLGNSPDPIDLMDKYGADGLRFGIISIAPKGQDIMFNEERIEQGRNFCNKLWNACRFRQMSGKTFENYRIEDILGRLNVKLLDEDDIAILGRLMGLLDAVENNLNAYEFSATAQEIYRFFWTDFCDWYLEVCKVKSSSDEEKENSLVVTDLILRELLLVLHPFTPFITEELWHLLGYGKAGEFIQDALVHTGGGYKALLSKQGITMDPSAIKTTEAIRESVTQVRALKANYNVGSKKDVTLYYKADASQGEMIQKHHKKLKSLLGAEKLESASAVLEMPAIITPLGTFYIDLKSTIDVGAERDRLSKELEKLEKWITATEQKLSNKNFTDKAPPHVLEGVRSQLSENQAKCSEIKSVLKSLG